MFRSKKNIDTGAGLERIASIVQNVPTLLDVDTIRAIVDKACEVTGTEYVKMSRKIFLSASSQITSVRP